MDNTPFFHLLRSLTQLTTLQLERIQAHVHSHLQRDLLHATLSAHPCEKPTCPHCQSAQVIHWGQNRGLWRYRCKTCARTFNQLQGTALTHLHLQNKWVRYATCLSEGMSLRKAALECDINLKTAFRWRHRFLRYALTTQATVLSGIVEADEIFTPESRKGSRRLVRPARERGGTGHGHILLVPVLIALDRSGHEADAVLLDKSHEQIASVLTPLLKRGSVLCSDGNRSYIRIAEASVEVIHKRLINSQKHRIEDKVYHIQTLNNYVSRWRGWMQKFHGVGTAYLGNYLAWFRVCNQEENSARSWMAGGMKNLTNI
jgi:transposase-like protein